MAKPTSDSVKIGSADIKSLVSKLDRWGKSLSPNERALLLEFLRYARLDEEPAHPQFKPATFQAKIAKILKGLASGERKGKDGVWAKWAQKKF